MNCKLCERDKPLTTHHLIPRAMHARSWFKNRFSNKEMKNRTIEICRDCHSAIHSFEDEKTLGKQYNTKELLLQHEKVATFIKWAAKQK